MPVLAFNKKMGRLTIGCRARILTLIERPSRNGKKGHFLNEDSWRRNYGGREVLLIERTTGGDFSVMLLGKGVTKLKRKDPNTVVNKMAWIPEEDLVLVDRNFDKNLDFIDWYQEHEDDFCPDCGTWFPDRGRTNPVTKRDFACPSCGYSE
jgi:hypothetical protein